MNKLIGLVLLTLSSFLYAGDKCTSQAEKVVMDIELANGLVDFEVTGHEAAGIVESVYRNEKAEVYEIYGSNAGEESRVYEVTLSLPKCELRKFELVEVE